MLNPFQLKKLLIKLNGNVEKVFGSRLINSPRIKNPKSKYFVPKSIWPKGKNSTQEFYALRHNFLHIKI